MCRNSHVPLLCGPVRRQCNSLHRVRLAENDCCSLCMQLASLITHTPLPPVPSKALTRSSWPVGVLPGLHTAARDQIVPECACKWQTRQLQQQLARNVQTCARQHKGDARRAKGTHPSSAAATTTADAAGLLQALVQLASRSTIMLGSHQAYVSAFIAGPYADQ